VRVAIREAAHLSIPLMVSHFMLAGHFD
jgi:hypothetical protein